MSKKNKTSRWYNNHKLGLLLLSPFIAYFGIYITSLIISLIYGAQPILFPSLDPHKEELRREWIADTMKLGAIPNFFLIVATHEIESCFYNPGEVYPDGYTDIRQGREYYLEPEKLYVAQVHYIFTLGFPRTTVMACSNPNQ